MCTISKYFVSLVIYYNNSFRIRQQQYKTNNIDNAEFLKGFIRPPISEEENINNDYVMTGYLNRFL